MTHYDIDYSKLQEPEKSNKAIADIKDYMGEAKFERLVVAFRSERPYTFDEFTCAMSFAGVQGFPCHAMYHHIYGVEGKPGDGGTYEGALRTDGTPLIVTKCPPGRAKGI